VIAGVAIEKEEELAPSGGVDDLVDAREDERGLRAVFVEISVINAHSPFFILFAYKNRIG